MVTSPWYYFILISSWNSKHAAVISIQKKNLPLIVVISYCNKIAHFKNKFTSLLNYLKFSVGYRLRNEQEREVKPEKKPVSETKGFKSMAAMLAFLDRMQWLHITCMHACVWVCLCLPMLNSNQGMCHLPFESDLRVL